MSIITLFRHRRASKEPQISPSSSVFLFWRRRQWMLVLFILIISILLGRAIYLQINNATFLKNQGNARYLRTQSIMAHRGTLMDRNDEPLAISTPVESVWVNPSQFMTVHSHWSNLAELLNIDLSKLEVLLNNRMQREFVYIKRHISPSIAQQINALKLPGVFLQREYRRYYPTGEISGHLLGFTNIDDQGQEGLELALNHILKGIPGAKRVLQDKNGRVIANVENLRLARSGKNIRLSLDRRLQYLAYRELKAAVLRSKARAGSAIILDVRTGELLAMVNQPAFNPNNRSQFRSEHYRNRIVTDVLEPGSTIKPFTIACALESGKYQPTSRVNTHPGHLQLGQYIVRDSRNYGVINLSTIIQKSSNVGASKIALSLLSKRLWYFLRQVGFDQSSGSGFPGEVTGHLPHFSEWHTTRQASISFGYGINVTLLQLARAYAALGNQGVLLPIRFLPFKRGEKKKGKRIMQTKTAQEVLQMLKGVVKSGGTGSLAQIRGWSIAGKTGTVRKHTTGGYSRDNYLALFAGLVPANAPRLVMVIMIDEPHQGSYYGGKVAAPVFAKVMAGTVRLLNIPPDEY